MAPSKKEHWERIHGDLLPLSKDGREAYFANHGISKGAYDQARYRYKFPKRQRKAAQATGGAFRQFVATDARPMIVKLAGGAEIQIPSGDVASLRAVIELCGGAK